MFSLYRSEGTVGLEEGILATSINHIEPSACDSLSMEKYQNLVKACPVWCIHDGCVEDIAQSLKQSQGQFGSHIILGGLDDNGLFTYPIHCLWNENLLLWKLWMFLNLWYKIMISFTSILEKIVFLIPYHILNEVIELKLHSIIMSLEHSSLDHLTCLIHSMVWAWRSKCSEGRRRPT